MLNEYEDPTLNNGKGDVRNVKGNQHAPYIIIVDPDTGEPVETEGSSLTQVPKGTLIPLTTAPAKLPTTPLTGRKWIRFRNEDLVDVELCDSAGVVFETLEPGDWSLTYYAPDSLDLYGKVANGTADIGVRAQEGK